MKLFKYSGILLFLVVVFSCEPPIVFTEPQPERVPPALTFNLPFRGIFLCEEDSTVVHVHGDCIFKEKVWQFNLSRENLDTIQDVRLIDNQLYSDFFDSYMKTEILPDGSYRGTLLVRDTFFHISNQQVLKYFQGYQVLSKKMDSGDWEVWLLGLDEYLNLTLHKTALPEDLNRIQEISPMEDISTPEKRQFRLTPTIIEFSELLDRRLIFEACGYYERIELERAL